MKKILIALLICSFCLSVYADEVDFSPKWANIAPAEYSNDVQYIENNTFNKKKKQ